MKLQITPTPAGTGYRCECLDTGVRTTGDGATELMALACFFERLTPAGFVELPRGIEINGVPWRREGERTSPPAPPPAVGVPVDREQMLKRFRREFLFLMPGIVLTDKKRGFVDRMARRAVWALEKEGILPDSGDKEMPPHIEWDVNGVPVQVVERLLKRAIEDEGGWHIHDADLTWFKEHYEAARQGKVYADTWPSRVVPVEVLSDVERFFRAAVDHDERWKYDNDALIAGINGVPLTYSHARTALAAIEAARRGEGSGQAESHLQCDRNLATVTADASRLANELADALYEVERLKIGLRESESRCSKLLRQRDKARCDADRRQNHIDKTAHDASEVRKVLLSATGVDPSESTLGLAKKLAERFAALTAERDKLTQDHQALAERLRESEAGAAAMRKELQSFVDRDSQLSINFGLREPSLADARAALAGTAGRDLLAELEAKDQRIAELEKEREQFKGIIDHQGNELSVLGETERQEMKARIAELEAKLTAITAERDERNRLLIACFKAASPDREPVPIDYIPGDIGSKVGMFRNECQRLNALLDAKLKAAEPPPAAPDIERLATDTRIDDSLSGRDLDAAIAEKLFGWTWQDYALGRVVGYPKYHSSWEAMRLVVEEMQRRGFMYSFGVMNKVESFYAWFSKAAIEPTYADDLPTAVCRAALLAIAADISSSPSSPSLME